MQATELYDRIIGKVKAELMGAEESRAIKQIALDYGSVLSGKEADEIFSELHTLR